MCVGMWNQRSALLFIEYVISFDEFYEDMIVLMQRKWAGGYDRLDAKKMGGWI
jgi:hypothetical protein